MRVVITAMMLASLAGPATAAQSPFAATLIIGSSNAAPLGADALMPSQMARISHLLENSRAPLQIRSNVGAILGNGILDRLLKRK